MMMRRDRRDGSPGPAIGGGTARRTVRRQKGRGRKASSLGKIGLPPRRTGAGSASDADLHAAVDGAVDGAAVVRDQELADARHAVRVQLAKAK